MDILAAIKREERKLEKHLGKLQHQLNGIRAAAKALGDYSPPPGAVLTTQSRVSSRTRGTRPASVGRTDLWGATQTDTTNEPSSQGQ